MKKTIKKYIQKFPKRKVIQFEGFCANCEHPVNGHYCSNCGQSVIDFHRPFFSVLSESLGDALSLDNKFLHTIVPLFIRPGYLTKEFMRGKRAKYTPPFRLYLFLTFFAFLLLSHNHKPETDSEKNLTFKNDKGKEVQFLSYFDKILDEDLIEDDSLGMDSLTKDVDKKNKIITFNYFDKISDRDLNGGDRLGVDSLTEDLDQENKIAIFNTDIDSVSEVDTIPSPINVMSGGENINKELKNLINMWRLNPTLMIDNAFKKLSQTLLVILPVFALFLALFYIRRKHYLLEHLLISLNFHSFVFVIVIVSELLIMTKLIFLQQLAFYLYLLIPIQLFLAMKFYYQQSWLKTLVKFFMLSLIYNILLVAGILYSLISLIIE